MVGVTAKTQKFCKNAKFIFLKASLIFLLVFFYTLPAEGIRVLEKETEDEAVIEDIYDSAIESEILESIKEFEKAKEEIIKEEGIKKEIESPVFKSYSAPLSAPYPVPIVEEKKTPQTSKPLPKKKNILFDVIFFSVILASFFGIKTLLNPT